MEAMAQVDAIPAAFYIKHALEIPFLMHEVLALSALHLSTRDTKSRQFYRSYAIGLQNRALSLFHATIRIWK